jgi:hypothetical protein
MKKKRNKTRVERKNREKKEKNSPKIREVWTLHILGYWYRINTRKQTVKESDKHRWINR